MVSTWAYSLRKKSTNRTAEYSVWKPETSSLSASTQSKGGLKVSARAETKKSKAAGRRGRTYQTVCWARTISVRLREPAEITTAKMIRPIDTS
jgi:hypothetical protein